MINNISQCGSAFYLPTYPNAKESDYFYRIFKQALESGYCANDALILAMQKTNNKSKDKNKRVVEANEKSKRSE